MRTQHDASILLSIGNVNRNLLVIFKPHIIAVISSQLPLEQVLVCFRNPQLECHEGIAGCLFLVLLSYIKLLFEVSGDGGIFAASLKSGATQGAAGAAANELWFTASHATLPDNVILIGA